jgi:hypothetical protein
MSDLPSMESMPEAIQTAFAKQGAAGRDALNDSEPYRTPATSKNAPATSPAGSGHMTIPLRAFL